MSVVELGRFMDDLADASGKAILPFFRAQFGLDDKARGGAPFDPVTEADRAAEVVLRAMIGQTFPGHGILGEEFGAERTDAECVWVLDPIDGTRAFIGGLPTWGTLIGLTRNGVPVRGMMHQPYLAERSPGTGAAPSSARRRASGPCAPAAAGTSPRPSWPRRIPACSRPETRPSASGHWKARCGCPATAPIATPTACWRPARSTSWSRPV